MAKAGMTLISKIFLNMWAESLLGKLTVHCICLFIHSVYLDLGREGSIEKKYCCSFSPGAPRRMGLPERK